MLSLRPRLPPLRIGGRLVPKEGLPNVGREPAYAGRDVRICGRRVRVSITVKIEQFTNSSQFPRKAVPSKVQTKSEPKPRE